jgi:ATP-dependent DNA helicase RecG
VVEDVIAEAREVASRVLADDPDLRAHPVLAEEVRRLDESEAAAFLEKG